MGTFDFQKQVIERSYEQPVVVDFWATWCGPCRMLTPVLEELATAQAGRWELVKLNTEEFPDVARQYQVMSIPNVKMFRDGEVVDEFVGVQPRRVIEKWLDENIPSQEKKDLQNILAAEKQIPDPQLRQQLEDYLQHSPGSSAARVALARHLLFEEPARAAELVRNVQPGDDEYEQAEAVSQLVRLLNFSAENGSAVSQKMAAASKAVAGGQLEPAIQAIIEAVSLDKNFQDDLPRKSAVALFHLLGDQHPLTKQYRWRFDMALY